MVHEHGLFTRSSIHVLEAHAQIIPPGDDRKHRGRPQAGKADQVDPFFDDRTTVLADGAARRTVHGPAEMDEFGSYGSKEEMEEAFAATGAFNDKLHADGYWVFAGGLQSASTATVVDGQGETPVMTDGPYLETKEVIGGFVVLDVASRDEALKWAAKIAVSCRCAQEVREIMPDPETEAMLRAAGR